MRTLLLLLMVAAPAWAQIPDTTFLSSARADALTGLYVLEDGRVIDVLDLRDELNGRPVLSVTEYSSGRVCALYALQDSGFEAGSAWFRRDSVAYRVRFDETRRPSPALTWEEGGRSVAGRRAPLVEREVTIQNGNVQLAGTLVLPPGPGPHPAIIYVPGSGPETRRIPRYVGDFLAYHGVAVLVTDKRGMGGSTGNWNGLGHADWASDVEAQLDFLRTQRDVDPNRLGLSGATEGGFVVPVVAARRSDVRFLVCRVCSGLPHAPVVIDIQTGILRRSGAAEADVAQAGELLERMMRYALTRTGYDSLVAHAARGSGRPWQRLVPPTGIPAPGARYWDVYRAMLVVDPREHYARLRIPVLAILGERDDRILVDKHRAVFESLQRGGVDLDLWVVPEASHGLLLGVRNSGGYPRRASTSGSCARWPVLRACGRRSAGGRRALAAAGGPVGPVRLTRLDRPHFLIRLARTMRCASPSPGSI